MSHGGTRVSEAAIYTLEQEANPLLRTPDWAKDAIWYQVMVDRFRNGTKHNDPPRARDWRSEWYASSPWEGRDGQSFYEWFVFDRLYGGDIRGLEERLDHLSDLGVNALYLNPMFQAEGHHKYNTTNYIHVDENFGAGGDYAAAEAAEDLMDPGTWTWTQSDRIFLEFLKTAKARGFRVIIDGVFNHVGTQHPAFRDVIEKGRDSPYADWFDVRSWDPFKYEGWAGFCSLPVFRKSEDGLASSEARQHIFDITRRWMDPDGDGDPSDGIDGWRLDVPNEIALPFWIDWCAHVRSINPDAYITGEIWDEADEWLDGRSFDAVMNYEFSKAVFQWVGNHEEKIGPTEVDESLARLREAYPAEITYVLQNLLDSHDTDRAVSKLFNPDRPYDRGNREQEDPTYDGGRPDEDAFSRLKLLSLMQMTYVGAPMIYYGDEVGMWGSDDPNNRKPMLWKDLEPYDHAEENRVSTDLLEHYREVIALRVQQPALRRGSFQTMLLDDAQDVWAYVRRHEESEILVALNAGTSPATITLPEGVWHPIHPANPEALDEASPVIDPLSGRVWSRVGP
jgi:glycosidase